MLNPKDKKQKQSLDFGEELSDEASSKVMGGSLLLQTPTTSTPDQPNVIDQDPVDPGVAFPTGLFPGLPPGLFPVTP